MILGNHEWTESWKFSKVFKTSFSKYNVACANPHPSEIGRGREEPRIKGISPHFHREVLSNIRDNKKHLDGQLRITLETNFFVGTRLEMVSKLERYRSQSSRIWASYTANGYLRRRHLSQPSTACSYKQSQLPVATVEGASSAGDRAIGSGFTIASLWTR